MKYMIVEVEVDALPDGMTLVIVEREDAPPVMLLSGDAARCWRTIRGWEDMVEPSWQPSIGMPLQLAV